MSEAAGTGAVVAYVPVLHDGYRRFLEAHGRGRRMFVVGPELYRDFRPLAKDIRALDAELVRAAIDAWGICAEVAVLDERGAEALAAEAPPIVLPAEDVSYLIVDRWLDRCPVSYATPFLRWDKTRTAQLLEVDAALEEPLPWELADAAEAGALEAPGLSPELAAAAEAAGRRSIDWWRRVGAAIRFADGEIDAAGNVHSPHPLAPYAVGDPRANFHKGVHLERSTATHAEAELIARAARRGTPTEGAVIYVTDFPCPPCAKLIAAAGISKLYFRVGYAVLDGEDVLAAAGVEIVRLVDEADG